ncbi:adenosine deaminase [Clostridium gasigenes]|uniref:Adenosine deaminase n=1 Tax=Clostridium gasigenes TaxID=94869 RepID=A0A1H0ULN9_9CLOT|nr:adenosine deaminase [Clostridium gasigenes]MBB6623143.1 adenosine deaminase [Clostridium gasigenes]SDP66993.1 adenosine deaminase [Clostridium gasigenes]
MNFFNLPKIELHCHLDGSVRAETIIDIAKKDGITISSFNIDVIKNQITAPLECTSLDDYLKSFSLPNLVMQSKENIKRITFELYEDASKENVKYMEVRFAPLLHTAKGLTIDEIIGSVIEGIKSAENIYDIKGNVILSCMRTMSSANALEVIEKGKKFLGKGVVAVDLAGPEKAGFAAEYVDAIKVARDYGYRVTIHAGETGIGKNVLDAVELLGAERIGHGVYINDCIEAYNIVKAKNIVLEICPTSNVQTKAVQEYKSHPIHKFYNDGIKITINTDNRTVSDTDMTKECQSIYDTFNITQEDYKQIYLNSVNATFTTEDVKEWLKDKLTESIKNNKPTC